MAALTYSADTPPIRSQTPPGIRPVRVVQAVYLGRRRNRLPPRTCAGGDELRRATSGKQGRGLQEGLPTRHRTGVPLALSLELHNVRCTVYILWTLMDIIFRGIARFLRG